MTDYSLYAASFTALEDDNAGSMQSHHCGCNEKGGKPTFPIIVWVPARTSFGIDEKITIPRRFALAFGIIDYIEQTYRYGFRYFTSTMKGPKEYVDLFTRQFTHYFKM